jgi:hypothetical protein
LRRALSQEEVGEGEEFEIAAPRTGIMEVELLLLELEASPDVVFAELEKSLNPPPRLNKELIEVTGRFGNPGSPGVIPSEASVMDD